MVNTNLPSYFLNDLFKIEQFLLIKLSKIYSFFARTLLAHYFSPDWPQKKLKLLPETLGNSVHEKINT